MKPDCLNPQEAALIREGLHPLAEQLRAECFPRSGANELARNRAKAFEKLQKKEQLDPAAIDDLARVIELQRVDYLLGRLADPDSPATRAEVQNAANHFQAVDLRTDGLR